MECKKCIVFVLLMIIFFVNICNCSKKEKKVSVEPSNNITTQNNEESDTTKNGEVDAETSPTKKEYHIKKEVEHFRITKLTYEDDRTYSISLDNNLIIKNIRIEEDEVILPCRKKRKKRYYMIKAYTRKGEDILQAIKTAVLSESSGNPRNYSGEYQKLEISNIEISLYKKPGTLKGFAEIVLRGGISISGFLLVSKGYLKVKWPSMKKKGKYKQVVFTADEDRKEIENKILNTFKLVAKEQGFEIEDKEKKESASKKEHERHDIILTSIKGRKSKSTVIINKQLKICDVQIKNKKVIFPFNTSSSGKIYKLVDAPYKGSKFQLNNLKKSIIKRKKSKKSKSLIITDVYVRKKYARVTFNNGIVISGFRINNENTIDWPSVKEDGEYKQKIFMLNRKLKNKIETRILNAYHKN